MPTYDYCCDCSVVTEARRGIDVKSIPCPVCGADATRRPFHRVFIACEGLPTRAGIMAHERRYKVSEFQEASADIAYEHEKAERCEGRKLPQPNLYKAAKRRAKKLMKAGIKNVKDVPYA